MKKILCLGILGVMALWTLSCAPTEDIDAMVDTLEKLEREVAYLKQKVSNQDVAIDFIREALKEKRIEVKVPEPVEAMEGKPDVETPTTPEEPEKPKTQKKLK
jgi:hypothetical protein